MYWYYNINTLCTPGHYCGLISCWCQESETHRELRSNSQWRCLHVCVCMCVCVCVCVFACVCVHVCVCTPLSVAPPPLRCTPAAPVSQESRETRPTANQKPDPPSTRQNLSHITTLQTFLFGWVLSFIMFSWIHLDWAVTTNEEPRWIAVLDLRSWFCSPITAVLNPKPPLLKDPGAFCGDGCYKMNTRL